MLIVNSRGTFVNRETTSKLTKTFVGLKQNSLSLPKKLEVLFNMNFEGMYGFMILSKPAFPVLYLRYVDDIFCVFRSSTSHEPFLSKLNNFHTNLKFTSEIGPSQLSFLDTCISLPTSDEEIFTSKVFRKSTYTGLMFILFFIFFVFLGTTVK